jgi:hypothetical protein
MRAIALNDADAMHPAIEMDTEVGRMRGVWRGASGIANGDSVDVELDLPRPRSLADLVIDPPSAAAPGMLRGVVTAVFDDGVIVLQVGSSAIQVELDDSPPGSDVVGATVDVPADDLGFHPSGL